YKKELIMIAEQEIEKMVKDGRRKEAIALLEQQLAEFGEEEGILERVGELIYAEGELAGALNKFNAVLRLNSDNRKARNYVTMINNILGYYCKDLLNP
ncbi:MAG: hypothetical protein K2L23_01265, partial [Odoribacter sp.]|nr:hypothetical protein [Odoribacter sp.]